MLTQQIQTFQPCNFGNGWGEFVDIENCIPVNKNKLPTSINHENQTNTNQKAATPNQELNQQPSQIEKIHINQNYMFNLVIISIITIVGYCMPIKLKTITNVVKY